MDDFVDVCFVIVGWVRVVGVPSASVLFGKCDPYKYAEQTECF